MADDSFRWATASRAVSAGLAALAVAIGLSGLAGHVLDMPLFAPIHPVWARLSLGMAVDVTVIGLCSLAGRLPRASTWPPLLLVMALALLVTASYGLFGEDRIGPAFGQALGGAQVPSTRMSLPSAVGSLLLALAAMPGALSIRSRDLCAGGAFLIGLTGVLGHAYGTADLGALHPFRALSLDGSICLLALAVSLILSDPAHGWARVITGAGRSGRVTRRQLLYALVPAVVGFLLIHASQRGLIPITAATALLIVLTVVPLLWLVLHDGETLAALEEERAERLRLVEQHGRDLQCRLDAQAEALSDSNAKLLAIAEAASERSQIRYRQLFDSIEAGFCVIELRFDGAGAAVDYRFVEVNPAFAQQTGLADAVGRWVRDLVPGLEQHWFDIYGAVARTGAPTRFENPAAQLGDRWYDVYAFRLDTDDNLVGVLFNDISDRRRADLELKAINETLEQRVEAAMRAREEAQAALRQSQKMEAMGQLTGGVAHDFNNLLTPILSGLDMLNRRGNLLDREQRLVAGALQSAERAKTLVQRLLAFARRQPLQTGPIDVGALIAGLVELVASTCGPQIDVAVEIAPDAPLAIGDANQLEMAVLNLCVNARDAMPEGGRLSLSVAPAPPPPGLPAGGYVCVVVADTGIGMDAETAARAIEPFFSTKGIGKGTGLGLSMVHGLALQLGGLLSIDSAVGRGTRIELFLRAGLDASPAPALSRESRPDHAVGQASGRALVVDDQDHVRMTTAHILQELGFDTEECDSGTAAERRLAADERFDLVVTDHLMPGLTGAELAARLARSRPDIAVLVISGYSADDVLAPELNFLRKPFRKADLAAAVERLVGSRGATEAVHS